MAMSPNEFRAIRTRLGLSPANMANLLQFTGNYKTVTKKIGKIESGKEGIGAVTEGIVRDLDENGLPERPDGQ